MFFIGASTPGVIMMGYVKVLCTLCGIASYVPPPVPISFPPPTLPLPSDILKCTSGLIKVFFNYERKGLDPCNI